VIRAGKAAVVASAAFLLAAGVGVSQQRPTGLQDQPRRPVPGAAQGAVPPGTVKSVTRLITVDVVATDSHGNAVRDLKQSDLQVFDERGG